MLLIQFLAYEAQVLSLYSFNLNFSICIILGFTSVLEISGSFTSQGQSESDQSVAVLPPEALCDWLKCAFGLTEITSKAYLRKIYEPYRRKTDAKVHVDE